jgi:cysteate synthase
MESSDSYHETRYTLHCPVCGRENAERHYRLECDNFHEPGLLRSTYKLKNFLETSAPGIFKYSGWLPGAGEFDNTSLPATYRSEKFGGYLGLERLFISFNGYWPERGARMLTCSFKELEAAASISRYLSEKRGRLVVASAGNTARAFAQICSQQNIPLMLIVPDSGRDLLWLTGPAGNNITLLTIRDTDYSGVIGVAKKICQGSSFIDEGGALNIARRDGMGVVMLDFVRKTGMLPDHYFQAVGSGTGALAVWEANLRLIDDGSYGNKKTKLHLSQNYPFCPMHDAWKAGSRQILSMDKDTALAKLDKVEAKVLSNRTPPYSFPGGVYDALEDTAGLAYSVNNQESRDARNLFERLENIDIGAPASVAVASLVQAVSKDIIGREDAVLLNITGGGLERLKKDHFIQHIKPVLTVSDPLEESLIEFVKNMKPVL